MTEQIRSFRELVARARQWPPHRIAAAAANDTHTLGGLMKARELGLVLPTIIGSTAAIRRSAAELGCSLDGVAIIEEANPEAACARAVAMARDGECDLAMKGLVSTRAFAKSVLSRSSGLAVNGILSHITLFESPDRDRLVVMSDAGVNIKPSLERKAQILGNALACARALGIAEPKAAAIAAIEVVEPDAMPATVEADRLRRMGEAGRFGRCAVDGPLALDNALDEESARLKSIRSVVAGRADVIIVPEIECGNVIYKAVGQLSRRDIAGAMVGASVPLAVASRSDSVDSKVNSIAFGILLLHTEWAAIHVDKGPQLDEKQLL
ncbi:MAG TPA: phosphate acyltransferase [Candidatus Brocadiia bacterium]|nr:phosphate acyltransferase [Candidatus Brocadiia bacterium]